MTPLEAEAEVDELPDNVDNANPFTTQQLKDEAAALEGNRKFEDALEKYEAVLVRQQERTEGRKEGRASERA